MPALCVFSTALGVVACTESPGYLPPGVGTQAECAELDCGTDGDASEASVSDGSHEMPDASESDGGHEDAD